MYEPILAVEIWFETAESEEPIRCRLLVFEHDEAEGVGFFSSDRETFLRAF